MNVLLSRSLRDCAVVSFIVLFILYVLFDLSNLNIHYPIKYSGDGLDILARIKMLVDGSMPVYGVTYENHLSAPFGMNRGDFSAPNWSQNLFIKSFSLFSNDTFVIYNLYIISSYFTCAYGMYFLLRKLSISSYVAICFAVLFSFVPFHYLRIGHAYYVHYFYIPFFIYLCLRVIDDVPLFYKKKNSSDSLYIDKYNSAIIIALVFFLSVFNFYYTFFFCFFIIVSIIYNVINKSDIKNHLAALTLLFVAIMSFIVAFYPYYVFSIENGINSYVGQRIPEESLYYSLRFSNLFMFPIGNYLGIDFGINPVDYDIETQGSLGLVALFGFILSIVLICKQEKYYTYKKIISFYVICGLLLSMYAGVSYLFASYISSGIRGYARIYPFILCFSLIYAAYFFDGFNKYKWFKYGLVTILFVTSLLLSVDKDYSFSTSDEIVEKISSDRVFVHDIESLYGSNNKIVQLPYMSYPENGMINKMKDYSYYYPWFYSKNSYWSGGAVRGRELDLILSKVATLNINEQVSSYRALGYNGILIDKFGYEDNGLAIITKLSDYSSEPMVHSNDQRYAYIPLNATGKEHLDYHYGPILLSASFYPWEGEEGSFVWSAGNGYINFDVNSDSTVSFELVSLDKGSVVVSNQEVESKYDLSPGIKKPITIGIKKGKSKVYFKTRLKSKSPNPQDKRRLAFGLSNVVISE
jgi:phosphoglycerol transferase